MKKTIYGIGIALIALSSCSVKEEVVESHNSAVKVTFQGTAFPQTRTSIGEKNGNSYPVLWSIGDKIGVASTSSELFANASARLIDEDSGKNSGVFILDNETEIPVETEAVIYYPFSEATTFEGDVLKSWVPMEQRQSAANACDGTGRYSLAYDVRNIPATVVSDESSYQPPVTFSLKHATAYVKLVISSSEYASYKLAGASLWSEGAEIVGKMDVNVRTGNLKVTNPCDYVTVTVDEPSALRSEQTLWLVTLPVDLTGKDVYVSVSMTDGKKNVTIPVKVNGGKILANTVNTITIKNVSKSDNKFAWYEPEETRMLAEGWAYGPQNTFMATEGNNEFTIDVKARGFFNGCEEPKYAKIIYAHNLNGSNYPIVINGKRNNPKSPDDYAEFVEINPDYTLTIRANKDGYTGYVGKVGICNAKKEYIWSFNIWYVPQGVQEHQYKNGVVMDRNLGNGYAPDYDNWHGVGIYCQWGRPFGFSWGSQTYKKASTNVTNLKVSAKNPDVFFYTDGADNHLGDWYLGSQTGSRSDRKDDFWGNPNNGDSEGSVENGEKTIFDPCPAGWMVVSPAIIKEVIDGREQDFKNGSKMKWLVYKYDGEHEAYWPFSGVKWGNTAGNPTNQMNDIVSCWSNSPSGGYNSTDHKAYQLWFRFKSSQWASTGTRASGQSVRCMKDTENR